VSELCLGAMVFGDRRGGKRLSNGRSPCPLRRRPRRPRKRSRSLLRTLLRRREGMTPSASPLGLPNHRDRPGQDPVSPAGGHVPARRRPQPRLGRPPLASSQRFQQSYPRSSARSVEKSHGSQPSDYLTVDRGGWQNPARGMSWQGIARPCGGAVWVAIVPALVRGYQRRAHPLHRPIPPVAFPRPRFWCELVRGNAWQVHASPAERGGWVPV